VRDKKIGLIGGIGPALTVEFYLGIIEKCHKEQGKNIYPEIVIDSVNMSRHDTVLAEKSYEQLGEYLRRSLTNLKAAEAENAAITAKAEHIVWDKICDKFPLPVISIVDATISEIKQNGLKKSLYLERHLLVFLLLIQQKYILMRFIEVRTAYNVRF